jgi:hypothetical protein
VNFAGTLFFDWGAMREAVYQARLIRRLRNEFPGCVILKNDTDYQQGIPDLVIFFGERWAMLEVKASRDSDIQPNQDYWVGKLDEMSYAAFIFPENESEVIDELREALQPGERATRIS